MTKKNARIFLRIFVATMLVVAYVWYITAPDPIPTSQETKPLAPAAPRKPAKEEKMPTLPAPKLPTVPKPPQEPIIETPPVSIDMGIPALKPEKKISTLAMPDILPRTKEISPTSDERQIAASVITSGDEFFRLLGAAISLVSRIF
jgi:hypothetical protein